MSGTSNTGACVPYDLIMGFVTSVNPATGRELERFELSSPADVERALDGAQSAFARWRLASFDERAAAMRRAAEWLEAHVEECARRITLEMGKSIGESRAEIRKCAWNCRFYATEAARFLAPQPHASSASESLVAFRPLGCVLAVMPWNFPFWQLFRFAAPALMAGNVAVLKHASNVPGCARAIERAFVESGFPGGAFANLYLPGAEAEALIDDPRVAAITLTGSDAVGERVGRRAGAAVKKAVLELGGSDPFIVLADADVERAAEVASRARFQNAGQSCIAAKRFLVERPVHDAFVEALVRHARAVRLGDPIEEQTTMGPLAREDLRAALDRQVQDTVAEGARVRCGGAAREGEGWFYLPTVLTGVTETMAAFREETFGPVAAVTAVEDADHAVALANLTRYGLGAALWTRDLTRAGTLAASIDAGSVFINGMVASDPRLPFGGIKKSGYGRELSEYGIREFTNIQTVWMGPARE